MLLFHLLYFPGLNEASVGGRNFLWASAQEEQKPYLPPAFLTPNPEHPLVAPSLPSGIFAERIKMLQAVTMQQRWLQLASFKLGCSSGLWEVHPCHLVRAGVTSPACSSTPSSLETW